MKVPKKTILICPLNWGLGHATRDIPIIQRLIKAGHHVVIATESPLTQLFEVETPKARLTHFPGPKIRYCRYKWWLIPKLLFQLPGLIRWIWKEKKIVTQLAEQYKPDCIISDNRYGARCRGIKSIIITHQLMIKLPLCLKWLEKSIHLVIKYLITRFNECWIPDNPLPHSLAGELAYKYPLPTNAKLIGPLSRFMDHPETDHENQNHKINDLLIILSGPEPQKSLLEQKLLKILPLNSTRTTILTGNPGQVNHTQQILSHKTYTHLPKPELFDLLINTPVIISRSGYSTIMDLWFLNKKAILIPTPGQTEQLYLAEHHSNHHLIITQNKISPEAINPLITYCISNKGSVIKKNPLLEPAIRSLE